ncbi:hypothetical protein J6590_083598 [Homalodisca vitripennis]|nr:hypothetical protein J6590_083598 [Homalodisca vitripennis]
MPGYNMVLRPRPDNQAGGARHLSNGLWPSVSPKKTREINQGNSRPLYCTMSSNPSAKEYCIQVFSNKESKVWWRAILLEINSLKLSTKSSL